MRSNYKRLGDYIEPCDEKNDGNLVKELRGISNQKYFQKAKTNTIGIDLSKYRIVRTGQFAFNRATTRNGDKISIALRQGADCIVSPSYRIFKSKNENILNSEYLMMWFRRPEFDRYARFKSHGSAHEFFDYDEMCEVELPIPSIEKQREIVKEYNTVVNRIKLNEQLNQKLEETAQALYKHWFVDFEFPNEKGEPYKSNGGAMVYNEELDKEIPEGWENLSIQDLIDQNILFKNQDGNHGELHPKSSDYVSEGVPFIMANDVNDGVVDLKNCKFISAMQAKKLRIKPAKEGDVLLTHKATMGRVAIIANYSGDVVLTPQVTYYRIKDSNRISKEFLYGVFTSHQFQNTLKGDSEQSTRSFLSITNQRHLKILLPIRDTINKFSSVVDSILAQKNLNYLENHKLIELESLILSKMTRVEQEKEVIN